MKPSISTVWKKALQQKKFKVKLLLGFFILISLLLFYPIFFQYIEQRQGVILNDWLLNKIPAKDVSLFVFIPIWFITVLTIYRCITNPILLLLFLWCYIFLNLSRVTTISFVPLNPPQSLIPLNDPLTNIFYGGKFIDKDLFYSGHTATLFLMSLCLPKKSEKAIAFMAALAVAVMVLIQHIHYSIDVLAAFPLTYLFFLLGKKVAK